MTKSQSPIEALTRFFADERRELAAYLRRRVRELSEMEAEDVVSDVALRLFEKPDLVAGVENLAGYVYRALQRRLADRMRERRRTVPLDDPAEGAELAAHELDAPSIERAMDDVRFRRRFFAALATLPEPQRAIWIATELEGRTFREMAEQWGEPLGTLLARKHRATEALRLALEDLR